MGPVGRLSVWCCVCVCLKVFLLLCDGIWCFTLFPPCFPGFSVFSFFSSSLFSFVRFGTCETVSLVLLDLFYALFFLSCCLGADGLVTLQVVGVWEGIR